MNAKGHPIWFKTALLGLDMTAVAAGSALAYYLRFVALEGLIPARGGYLWSDYLRLLPAALAAWFLALYSLNMYSGRQRVLAWRSVARIFRAGIGATGLVLAWVFFSKPNSAADSTALASYSRLLLLVWIFCAFVCVVMVRWMADRIIHHLRRHHQMAMARVVLAGSGEFVRQVAKVLRQYPEHGRHVAGVVLPPGARHAKPSIARVPILGSTEDLLAIVRQHGIDEVIIAQPNFPGDHLRELLTQCERDLVEFKIIPDLTEMLFTDVQIEEIDGIPFLGLRETPLSGWNLAAKRGFDLAASAILLAVLSGPMALCAWLVKRSSPGPIFYRQERVGADGKDFMIYKFRSMVQDAEDMTGPVFASDDDPRVTPVGRFLRRHRIDEWPQLFNILRGDMSLIGPRPERPFFVNRFKQIIPRYMGRHRVKSGVTGWAQVNGLCGDSGSIEQRLRYDIRYIEEWSWWLDLAILLRTVPFFFRPRRPRETDSGSEQASQYTARGMLATAESDDE